MRRLARSPPIEVACPSGAVLCLCAADSFALRLLGLSWSRALPPNYGLVIPRCRSVHGVGMLRSIDVVFADWTIGESQVQVLAVRTLHPLGFARVGLRANSVAALELNAGEAAVAGIEPGAELFVLARPSFPKRAC